MVLDPSSNLSPYIFLGLDPSPPPLVGERVCLYNREMWFLFVWGHVCVTWRFCMCTIARCCFYLSGGIYVWLDSFVCVRWFECDIYLRLFVRIMSHTCMSHVTHMNRSCLIFLVVMPHGCDVCVWRDSFARVRWLAFLRKLASTYNKCERFHVYLSHHTPASFVCDVTRFAIFVCNMTHSHASGDSHLSET